MNPILILINLNYNSFFSINHYHLLFTVIYITRVCCMVVVDNTTFISNIN